MGKLGTTARIAVLLLASGTRASWAQTQQPAQTNSTKPEETFYAQAQRAIFRLEHTEVNSETKQTTYEAGTGFFVETEKNNWYVITAAHVADTTFSYTATVPLPLDNGTSVIARMVLPRDKWEFHSSAPDSEHFRTDVAAMKIRLVGSLKSFYYCPKQCPENLYNQLDTDAEPPETVMVFGFPVAAGLIVSRPLGRQGRVAFVDTQTDAISVENKWFDKQGFVIDIPTITGGASGSPVIRMPLFGRLTLVGLISAANPLGGYAIAESVSRIRELLDRMEEQNTLAVDPWCLATEDEAKKITNNTIPVCK
jgi:hypothetical protein